MYETLQQLNILDKFSSINTVYDNCVLIDGEIRPDITLVNTKKQEIFNNKMLNFLREERNKKLDETDHYSMPDYPHSISSKQSWFSYRQALRDLLATASPQLDENGNLTNVSWPIPPS